MTERNTTYTDIIPGWLFGVVRNFAYLQAPVKSDQNNNCTKIEFWNLELGDHAGWTMKTTIGDKQVSWRP
eukprot:CAMPEP_0203781852 /NCGR_PEP_ID=MMETSP0099_2-20121227/10573_1 /ASSEMBLY_ACC=CAM_ASM_000209 /TAXON_ID=96639 /ORGANISM=" , Strain NY0313808BC1" /LENGTH=69 /DNA_ID=CAMNT_0050683099 /DNA_START=775 /DNA_END=980 /DNA_ORIENTATION=-